MGKTKKVKGQQDFDKAIQSEVIETSGKLEKIAKRFNLNKKEVAKMFLSVLMVFSEST